jgi:hypothetical protein
MEQKMLRRQPREAEGLKPISVLLAKQHSPRYLEQQVVEVEERLGVFYISITETETPRPPLLFDDNAFVDARQPFREQRYTIFLPKDPWVRTDILKSCYRTYLHLGRMISKKIRSKRFILRTVKNLSTHDEYYQNEPYLKQRSSREFGCTCMVRLHCNSSKVFVELLREPQSFPWITHWKNIEPLHQVFCEIGAKEESVALWAELLLKYYGYVYQPNREEYLIPVPQKKFIFGQLQYEVIRGNVHPYRIFCGLNYAIIQSLARCLQEGNIYKSIFLNVVDDVVQEKVLPMQEVVGFFECNFDIAITTVLRQQPKLIDKNFESFVFGCAMHSMPFVVLQACLAHFKHSINRYRGLFASVMVELLAKNHKASRVLFCQIADSLINYDVSCVVNVLLRSKFLVEQFEAISQQVYLPNANRLRRILSLQSQQKIDAVSDDVLMYKIFGFMSFSYMRNLRRVCRRWFELIEERSFWDLLLERDFPELNIEALMCLFDCVECKPLHNYLQERALYLLSYQIKRYFCKSYLYDMGSFSQVVSANTPNDIGVLCMEPDRWGDYRFRERSYMLLKKLLRIIGYKPKKKVSNFLFAQDVRGYQQELVHVLSSELVSKYQQEVVEMMSMSIASTPCRKYNLCFFTMMKMHKQYVRAGYERKVHCCLQSLNQPAAARLAISYASCCRIFSIILMEKFCKYNLKAAKIYIRQIFNHRHHKEIWSEVRKVLRANEYLKSLKLIHKHDPVVASKLANLYISIMQEHPLLHNAEQIVAEIKEQMRILSSARAPASLMSREWNARRIHNRAEPVVDDGASEKCQEERFSGKEVAVVCNNATLPCVGQFWADIWGITIYNNSEGGICLNQN